MGRPVESMGRGSQQEGTWESTGGDPIYGQGCLCRPGAGLSGARQAEGRQPRSRRVPQESDQSYSDFVLFRVVKVGWVSFPPSFFHFF